MKKIKKIFLSLVAFIVTGFTKIGGLVSNGLDSLNGEVLYGPPNPSSPTTMDIAMKIGNFVYLIIIFIIGFFIIFTKKISNKLKLIVFFALIILSTLVYVLFLHVMNFISTRIFLRYVEK